MDTPSYDTLLDLCCDEHRRIILGVLADQGRPLTLRDLANAVLTNNHHVPIAEADDQETEKIRCSLYHVHLPKLEAAGLIEYDPEREIVEPTDQLDQVQPTLSTILDADSSLEAPVTL